MKNMFLEKEGMLFIKRDPAPLEENSSTPCVISPISDDSRLGRLNKATFKGIEPHVLYKIDNYLEGGYYLRFEIVAEYCSEGSVEWALYQILNGKKVSNPAYCGYFGKTETAIGYGGDFFTSREKYGYFLNHREKHGWEIYEEPKSIIEKGEWYFYDVDDCYLQCVSTNEEGSLFRLAGQTYARYDICPEMYHHLTSVSLEPDFTNTKGGDECFSTVDGNGTVTEALDLFVDFPMESQRCCKCLNYQRNGKLYETSIHPTLFHSAAQAAAYFAEVALKVGEK